METAKEKNDANRKPLSPDEIASIVERLDTGRLYLGRRGAMPCPKCDGENTIWMRYIGHFDETAEWEYKCTQCGHQYFC